MMMFPTTVDAADVLFLARLYRSKYFLPVHIHIHVERGKKSNAKILITQFDKEGTEEAIDILLSF